MKNSYPWYDAIWLKSYVDAKKIIGEQYPDQLETFESMTNILKTSSDFETKKLDGLLSKKVLGECRELIKELTTNELEKQELFLMGRLVVHDHPYFNKLQKNLVDLVSEMHKNLLNPITTSCLFIII